MPRVPQDIALDVWIRQLIREDKIYQFYKSDDWLELRDEVMRDHHNECLHCMRNGIYKRAEMVHHVNEVRKRPDLALTKEFRDAITNETVINLIPLCNSCHEMEHPDRFGNYRERRGIERFTNEEKW